MQVTIISKCKPFFCSIHLAVKSIFQRAIYTTGPAVANSNLRRNTTTSDHRGIVVINILINKIQVDKHEIP